jgi:2-polyprenyl-3-methyl-5-hydroxy-6-metoxy-1,4-benzoquinol methylase
MSNIEITCPACDSRELFLWMSAADCLRETDMYNIHRCHKCDLGFAIKVAGNNIMADYSEYGDHITKQDDNYFSSRIKISPVKKLFFLLLKLFISPAHGRILDFGGGAGFFAKSCINSGYANTFLVEPSENFRRAAINRVKIDSDKVYASLDKVSGLNFDLVVMLDVIEHLPTGVIESILNDLFRNQKPGSYFFGVTPNSESINILLHKSNDPAVDPPRHVFYFNKKSLDFLLRKHGYSKVFSFTFGLSTNSFFRPSRNTPSWVEKPGSGFFKNILSFATRFVFYLISFPAGIFGKGYHVYYLYRRNPESLHQSASILGG